MNNDGLKKEIQAQLNIKKDYLKETKKGSFCEKHKSKTLCFLIISN